MVALFSPRLLVLHVVALVAVVGAGWLGVWQYGAWQDHRADRAAALADVAPRDLADVMGPDDPFPGDDVGRPVRFEGAWLPDQTVYVEGKREGDRSGYWVVTPVGVGCTATDGCTRPAMLVVRGWSDEPTAPLPSGAVALAGWLQPGEAGGPDAEPGSDVLPRLRVADVLQKMPSDLYGGFVIADEVRPPASADTALAPVTPDSLPKPAAFTSIRNLLYAIEWWVFGGFAVFLWWRWLSDDLARRRAAEEASGSADEEPEPVVSPEVPSGA